MSIRPITASLLASFWLLAVSSAAALMPFPKPEPTKAVANGSATPFSGAWAVVKPTMVMGERDLYLATCARPIRIEAASDTQILYLRPRQQKAGTAMSLLETAGGTLWEPIAGGDSFFAFWVSPDDFYLYDRVPQVDAEWGRPYVYLRCR